MPGGGPMGRFRAGVGSMTRFAAEGCPMGWYCVVVGSTKPCGAGACEGLVCA